MSSQLIAAVIFLVVFCLLLIVAQGMYKFLKLEAEVSRKFMHVSGGIVSLFFPYFFKVHWWVLLLCCIAFLVLLITYIKKSLPGIHKTNRLSFGSIFFPVPVYICFFAANKFDNYLLFVLPISILTISDTVAEWGGKRWGSFSRSFFQGQKTLAGSICFAVSCFFITLVMLAVIFRIPFGKSFLITASLSVIVTAVELVSLKGYDNLTVPISALALLILFLE
jgi:dolichol kinase